MFSIWIGGKPPEFEIACMEANNLRYGLTLIAEENWIIAKRFIPLTPLLSECRENPYCKTILDVWDDPRNTSEVLRVWFLARHPNEVYIDSDCFVNAPPAPSLCVQVPSCHQTLLSIMEGAGVALDTDVLKNSVGEFVEVYLIAGNGDSDFFNAWLKTWAEKYPVRGGIAEYLCYEPCALEIVPDETFSHQTRRSTTWQTA
jgi:hypothetical protein